MSRPSTRCAAALKAFGETRGNGPGFLVRIVNRPKQQAEAKSSVLSAVYVATSASTKTSACAKIARADPAAEMRSLRAKVLVARMQRALRSPR